MKHLLRFKTFLLMAIFSLLAGTSAWAQSDFSAVETSNVTLIKGTNASDCTVNGEGGIKVGTSSKGGDMSVTVPAGTKYLHLHAAAWKGVNSLSLNISEATVSPASISLSPDAGVSNNSPFTLSGDASDFYFVIELSNITTETTLKFTTSTTKRFVIWGVNAEEESGTGGDTSVATTVTIDASGIKNTDVYAGTDAGSLTATVSTDEGAISGAIVTWSGNNDAVATIDASTGAVTLVAAGSVTFTASYAGVEDTYKPSSKTYVMTVTNNDPTIPGTENNPYTVAQARAAIDAGSGTQGVYATGIVSEIITAYGYNNYSNITFNIVTQDGDSEFLQAFRCVSSTNADASTIAVGDIVVVSGNLTKYNTTYEFAQGCQVVSITHPAVSVEAPTFSPAAGTYADAQSVTISTATDGATVYYTTDGTEPTDASTPYTKEINISTTTTLKAIAYKGGESSTVATATYYICSAANPYTVTEALAFPEYPANGVYVQGIVSTAPTQTPTSNGQLTYYISVDGQATDQLQVYKGLGLNQATFTAQDDIQVGDEVTIYGNVKIYNSTKEFDTGNYLVAFNRPVVATPSITLDYGDEYKMDAKAGGGKLPVTCSNMPADPQLEVLFYESDGQTSATYDWISADIESNGNGGYYIDGQIQENTGDARTAYFKVHGVDANNNDVYSNLVTFTQSGPSIEFENYSIDIAAGGESRTLGFNYAGVGSTADDFEVCFYESDGETAATYDWITPSFNTESNKVKLEITVDANTGVARTAYFKVHAKNTTVYSNLYTVNQAAAPAATAIDLTKTLVFDIEDNGDLSGTYATNNTKTNLYGKWEGDATATEFEGFTFYQISKQNSFQFQANAGSLTFPIIRSAYGFDVTYVTTQNDVTVTIDGVETLSTTATEATLVLARTASGAAKITRITLTPKTNVTTPSITLPDGYQFEVNADGGDNELPVTCSNLAANPQLAVVFYEADGVTPATYDHTWITAVINSNGNIDGHIDENTGAQRTAYFKVTGKDANDNDVYSDLVTITQNAPVAATPTIVFNPNSIDFDANSGDRTIGGDYFQLKDFDSTPSLEILFYEYDGATSATYDWLMVGFNNEGKINIAYDENTGAARSAYLKLHAEGTSVYSNLFTVNQAAPTTDYVTLPFNWAGGASADLTAIAGVTASGIGSDYAATHDPYLVKFDSDGDYIQFKTNEQPGVVTIGVKMIGGGNTSTITVQGSADGDKFTDIEELTISGKQNDFLTLATTNEFDSSVRYIRLNFTKGSNVGVGPISIALPALVATPTFDPAAGEVQAGTLVTISTTTANATIRYTTDGSEPTTSNGEEYQKPIVINSDVTIKAIAVDDNWNVSAVAEATYTIATSSQLSPELTLDPKSLNVTEGAANGTVTVTTAAGYNGTITVMVDDPSVADASYDAGIITVVYGHAGSAVISVTAGADGDYVEQMEQISVNVSAPVQPAQAGVVVWSEDWSSFNLNDSETPAANGDFTYTYTDGNSATKLYNENSAGSTAPELLINKNGGKNGGAFSATIPLYGAYGNMTLTFKTNNKLTEVHAKVDDDTNNDITLDPANVNGKNVYTLSFPVAEGANQVVLTFTNNTSKNVRIDDFQLTAPQVAVNISSVGYSTMYYGSSNLTVPAGVTVSTYWVDGDLLKVSQEYTEGAVLAKAQGYVLSGAPGSYTFTATDDVANEDPKNALRGFDTAAQTTGGSTYFLLGVYNNKVGFYWGADNGAAFKSGSHKAYLAAPAGTGVRAFYFDDVYTGVDALNLNVENENAYDMQGRRVQQLQKGGLYILNGKKVLVK